MLLSFISSLAGIFTAYSTYNSYSTILTEKPQLTAALVMIIFQSIFAVLNLIVMGYMWYAKLFNYKYTRPFIIFFEAADCIIEIIIISLLSSTKAEYDKFRSHALASVVQQGA